MTSQVLSLMADDRIAASKRAPRHRRNELLEESLQVLADADRLLESHPTLRLERWVNLARGRGDVEAEQDYYEFNAKHLVNSWGYTVDDYSARI